MANLVINLSSSTPAWKLVGNGDIISFGWLDLEKVAPFLKEEGLIELIGCTEHPYQSPNFIKVMEEKGYNLNRGFEALEKRTRLLVMRNLLAKGDDLDKPNAEYGCDEKEWWYKCLYPSDKVSRELKEDYRGFRSREEIYSPKIILF